MTDFETRRADWLSVGDALRHILAAARPLPLEQVDLEGCEGRALGDDLRADVTLPPWDNAAMDGYAVRGDDVRHAGPDAPARLRVVERVRAGERSRIALGPGEAARIMTGAPVPAGADSVVRVEDTDAEEEEVGWVRVRSGRDAGGNVRPGGQDFRPGDRALERGERIGPGQVAVLAALGVQRVPVSRRPRVALLACGDELATPGEYGRVRAGAAIPESNTPMLAAAVRVTGGEAVRPGIARDEPESIERHLREAREADVLVTVGGASMGEADLFKRVLDGMGYELDFWRVRIRPGSPFSFGRLPPLPGGEPRPVFGLPGNPASAFVTFELFVRPFLLALAGHKRLHRRVVRAVAGEALRSPGRLTHFFRVQLAAPDGRRDGPPPARLAGHQSSGLVRSLGRADGLAVVPEGVEVVEPGEELDVILLNDGPGWTAEPEWLEGGD